MKDARLKRFKYWKTHELQKHFGIKKIKKSKELAEWLDVSADVSAAEKKELDKLQQPLIEMVQYWNEATLQYHFITPFIRMIGFQSDKYQSFLEAKLSLTHEGQTIQGKIDFLVASGEFAPEAPYFALHEYKPEPSVSTEPQGQLLVAMMAAAQENEKRGIDLPLYGTYIMGRFFFFVYFYKNQFATSLTYDSTKSDLYSVFNVLKKAKGYIDAAVERVETDLVDLN